MEKTKKWLEDIVAIYEEAVAELLEVLEEVLEEDDEAEIMLIKKEGS